MIVYTTRYLDIFWTLTSGSLYNTVFKLLFLAAQAYTLYLMLNDYKPTQDPNIDTFKVEYLLGGSAIIAILFPYKYEITEVS
jgi:ER lumen protein retaining receptor